MALRSVHSIQLYNILHQVHGAEIFNIRGRLPWVSKVIEGMKTMLEEQDRRIELRTGLTGQWIENHRKREVWYDATDPIIVDGKA